MRKWIVLLSILFLLIQPGVAQDFHYSQFYAAPLYLNPALTGITELSRVGLNYRKQWPGLAYDFNSFSAYFDHYSFDLKSGIGVALNKFDETNMNVSTSDVSVLYSYNLSLGERLNFKMGTQAAIVRRSADLDNLLFGDQVNLFSRSINPNTIDQIPEFEPYSYLDLSIGSVLTHENFWIGSSFHHVNQPRLSFYPDTNSEYLPLKWSVHGGTNFPLRNNQFFGSTVENMASIYVNYKKQGPFQQFDIGSQLMYQSGIFGLGYRGIPGLRNMPNNDSIILLFGLQLDSGLVIGYSYDFMISEIGTQTKGAHELSLRYQFMIGEPKTRNQRSRVLKCFSYVM